MEQSVVDIKGAIGLLDKELIEEIRRALENELERVQEEIGDAAGAIEQWQRYIVELHARKQRVVDALAAVQSIGNIAIVLNDEEEL